jgi:hypothetical protein
MASLESLSNPLESLSSLPSAANLRQRDSATGPTPVWSATQQYYTNDVVISAANGFAYVYTGDAPATLVSGDRPKAGIYGGADPSLDTTGGWVSVAGSAPLGVYGWEPIVPTIGASAGNVFVFTAPTNVLSNVPAGSQWAVSVCGTFTAPGPLVAADSGTITLTPQTGTALTWDIIPKVDTVATATRWSASGTLTVGGAVPQTITLSGTYAAAVLTPTALIVTLIRLV